MSAADRYGGACLCGGVRFEAAGRLRPVIVCHCRQCRTWSGHVRAATAVPDDRFRLIRGTTLAWFAASAQPSCGFCNRCGASLFRRPADGARIAIAAGALDPPTGLAEAEHGFTGSAGDYCAPEDPPPRADPDLGTADLRLPPRGGRLLRARPGRGDHQRIDDGLPQFPGPGPD